MNDLVERLRSQWVPMKPVEDGTAKRPVYNFDFGAMHKLQKQAADTLEQQAAEIERLRKLLGVSACPANCEDGIIPEQIGPDEWQPVQCQFCHERKELTVDI